jgi:hypothetical protein
MPDLDEIWYTDSVKHAEFRKRGCGSVTPFSKMAVASIIKIDEML